VAAADGGVLDGDLAGLVLAYLELVLDVGEDVLELPDLQHESRQDFQLNRVNHHLYIGRHCINFSFPPIALIIGDNSDIKPGHRLILLNIDPIKTSDAEE
jgi:hypothetical protein